MEPPWAGIGLGHESYFTRAPRCPPLGSEGPMRVTEL